MSKKKKYKPTAGRIIIGIYCFLTAVVLICTIAVIIIGTSQKAKESVAAFYAVEVCYGNN